MKKIISLFLTILVATSFFSVPISADSIPFLAEESSVTPFKIEKDLIKGRIEEGRADLREKREEIREDLKRNIELKREESRVEIKQIKHLKKEEFKNFKKKKAEFEGERRIKREEFRKEIEEKKTRVKEEIKKKREELKEKLKVIKDEKKQKTVEKIADRIAHINEQKTNHFFNILNKMDIILERISSRADKAEANDRDVSEIRILIDVASSVIEESRVAVSAQAEKVYSIEIDTEENLREKVKETSENLRADLKSVAKTVKNAHNAIREAVVKLAQIPQVDEFEVEEEVEDEEEGSSVESEDEDSVE